MKKLSLLLLMAFLMIIGTANAQKGYEKSIEFGYQAELGQASTSLIEINNSVDALNLSFVNGYRFNSYVFLGVGVGIDYSFWQELDVVGSKYFLDDCKAVSIPLFARGKFNFTKSKISPYFLFDVGYNILVASDYKAGYGGYSYKRNGVLVSPNIGVDFNFNKQQALYLHLGYNLLAESENDYSYATSINSISLKLGLKF